MQKKEKVGRQQARELVEGRSNAVEFVEDQFYEKYVHVKVNRDSTRSDCSFTVEKYFEVNYSIKGTQIISAKEGYILKVTDAQQYDKISKITSITDILCEVLTDSPSLRLYNSTFRLIYINEFDITDYTNFEEGIKRQHNINRVTQAFWIKSKNSRAVHFVINFAQN